MRSPIASVSKNPLSRQRSSDITPMREPGSTRNSAAAPPSISAISATPVICPIHASRRSSRRRITLRIYPADLGTAIGLRTDCHARVLRKDGAVIAGLYACGNDMGSIMNGNYPGPGITLGPALTFGYIGGRHLAQTDSEARAQEERQERGQS